MDKKPETKSGTVAAFSSNQIGPAALADLLNLLDPQRCREWLFGFLHPGEAARCCPGCGAELPERRARSYAKFKKTACPACGLQFRAKTGTAVQHCQLSPAEIVLAAALTTAGADAESVALALGRDKSTAKIWQGRLEGLQRAEHEKPSGENTPENG